MIIEEIQGNIANLSQDEKQKHVEKVGSVAKLNL